MPGTRQLEIIAEPGELQIRKMNIRNNADSKNEYPEQ